MTLPVGEVQPYPRASSRSRQRVVLAKVVQALALGGAGLLAGAVLAVFFLDAALGGDATFFVTYKQLQIRALMLPLPLLGAVVLLLSLTRLALLRRSSPAFWLTLGAVACFVAAFLITSRGHFPLNAQIAAWSAQSPPSNWLSVQQRWWQAHVWRTVATVAGYTLLLGAMVGTTLGTAPDKALLDQAVAATDKAPFAGR